MLGPTTVPCKDGIVSVIRLEIIFVWSSPGHGLALARLLGSQLCMKVDSVFISELLMKISQINPRTCTCDK